LATNSDYGHSTNPPVLDEHSVVAGGRPHP
jgi:hypothetical protein